MTVFFGSCVTFVIDKLVLKLCEPWFKLRTSWKIRIGDVLERGEILSCIQHFVKIKPLIRETKVSYLVSLENGILVPTSVWVKTPLHKLCMRIYSVSSEHHLVSCIDMKRNIPLSVICIFSSQLLKLQLKRSASSPLRRSSVSVKISSQLLMSKTGSKQHYSPESCRSIL